MDLKLMGVKNVLTNLLSLSLTGRPLWDKGSLPGVLLFVTGMALGLSSCNKRQPDPPDYLFELRSAETTGLDFVNALPVELELNIFNYLYYYNGGGIAVADFNNDSLPDIYFTSNLGKEKMFLNQGGLKFKDISDLTDMDGGPNGWSTGASVTDINGDGLLDIYLCQVGKYRILDNNNKLFICTGIDANGIPQYEESAAKFGLDFKGFSTHAGFFDYDLDGDLDMYLLNHSVHQNGTFGPRERFLNTVDSVSGDKLFRNDGGHFTDVTVKAGIQSTVIGYGLGLAFGDVNLDGYPDIYVGNDFHENDYLYINQKDGTFREELSSQIRHTSKFTMGVDMADINNDCYPDIYSLDMLPEDPVILKRSEGEEALDIFRFKLNYGYNHQFAQNALQLNNGNNAFSEIGRFSGVFASDWSWSPLLMDMDLDGQKDLFISNGIPKRMNDIDYINFEAGNEVKFKIQFDHLEDTDLSVINKIPEIKILNKFYIGSPSLHFEDAESRILNNKVSYSNSAAFADFDHDGDLDIVTNNIDDPAFLYENLVKEPAGKSLKVHLSSKGMNRDAIGAKILVYQSGTLQYMENFQIRGFQSSRIGPLVLSKTRNTIDSIIVIWPDNTFTRLTDVSESEIYITQTPGLPAFDYNRIHKSFEYQWAGEEKALGVDYVHEENPFVEFDREALIPFSTSSDGPALAVGDLNGDGLEDIFVGAAKWGVNALFFQKNDGTFERVQNSEMREDSTYEDIRAMILDVNNDGANDLVIATGGNEFRGNSGFNTPLLYVNDGSGSLSRKADAFPGVFVTSGGLEVFDFSGDGFPDVFIGARAKPWAYGEIPVSCFLVNDGTGKFLDATGKWLPEQGLLGFVKGTSRADIDEDGDEDILLALEWDGIKALMLDGDRFTLKTLCPERGWWNFVLPCDIDNDGDMDLLAGNQGLNTRMSVSLEEPMRMYYADFDDNGTKEQVLSYYVKGKEIPFHNKKELQGQMPFVKKKFIYAGDFAEATFTEIFPAEKLGHYFEADQFRSMVMINDGKGNFEARALETGAQQSPFYAAMPINANGDDLPDFIMMGNYFDANIMMGMYDANYGTLLINKGSGNFEVTQPGGEVVGGQVKNIRKIMVGGREYWIIARNNESLKVVNFKGKPVLGN